MADRGIRHAFIGPHKGTPSNREAGETRAISRAAEDPTPEERGSYSPVPLILDIHVEIIISVADSKALVQ